MPFSYIYALIQMSMVRKLVYLLSVIFLSLTIQSCDQCIGLFGKEKVECNNGGTCNDGECDCLKGYSGVSCDSVDICELDNVVCIYGDCMDGLCLCDNGYEGENCEVESRKKFLGEYTISEYCDPLDTLVGHKMIIEKDPLDDSKVHMRNVFNYIQFDLIGFYSKVSATPVTGSMDIKINYQEPDDNGKTITGIGTIDMSDTNNIRLNIDYTIVNGNKEYTCQLQAVKD